MKERLFPTLHDSQVGKAEFSHIVPQITFLDPRFKEVFFPVQDELFPLGYELMSDTPPSFYTKVGSRSMWISKYVARLLNSISVSTQRFREFLVNPVKNTICGTTTEIFLMKGNDRNFYEVAAEFVCGGWSIWVFPFTREPDMWWKAVGGQQRYWTKPFDSQG
jgi:hypothetical protein